MSFNIIRNSFSLNEKKIFLVLTNVTNFLFFIFFTHQSRVSMVDRDEIFRDGSLRKRYLTHIFSTSNHSRLEMVNVLIR